MCKFANPKLNVLYNILCDIFGDNVGWQDMGEPDEEMICLSVKICDDDDPENTYHYETLWISDKEPVIIGRVKDITKDEILFSFEK